MRRAHSMLLPFAAVAALLLGTGGCPTEVANAPDGAANAVTPSLDTAAESLVAGILEEIVANDAPEVEIATVTTVPVFTAAEVAEFEGDADEVDLSEEEFLDTVRSGPDDDGPPGPHGELAGRFMNDRPDSDSSHSPGVFQGRWFGAGGEVQGLLAGDYHPVRPDELPPGIVGGGVFQGHYVGNDGRFRGFLRGRYGHAEDGRGMFVGQWHDRHLRLLGVLRGHWEDAADRNGGRFAGRWAAVNVCDEADGLATVETDQDPAVEAELDALEVELDGLVAAEAAAVDAFAEFEDEVSVEGIDDEPDVLESDRPCVENAGFIRGWHMPGLPDGFEPNHPADGVWRARWRDASGEHRGHVRGLWAHRERPDDEPNEPNEPAPGPDDGDGDGDGMHHPRVRGTFAGRVFNAADAPIGVIRGVYGVGRHRMGVFRARFFNLDGEPRGALRGRWDNAPDRRGGPMFGRWARIDGGDDGGGDGGGEP